MEGLMEEGQGVAGLSARRAWQLFVRFLKATAETEKENKRGRKRVRDDEDGEGKAEGKKGVGGEGEEEEDAETMTFDDGGRKRLLGQMDQMEDELKQSLQHLKDLLDAI